MYICNNVSKLTMLLPEKHTAYVWSYYEEFNKCCPIFALFRNVRRSSSDVNALKANMQGTALWAAVSIYDRVDQG